MKLGISYNVFDGEELLEGSIKQIRGSVDFISVVYQTISNYGNPSNKDLINLLNKLVDEKLIDKIIEYTPSQLGGGHNEVNKRNIGLNLSKENGCTHHMSMDCDEYYLTSEFNYIKEKILDNDYDSSYCQMLTYYKTWDYILDPPETYYVSLIFKIKDGVNYGYGLPSPVLVDPTRNMNGIKNPKIFDRKEIQMHHGSYIRKDIRKKLVNSSAVQNFKNDIEQLVFHFEKWDYPQQVLWGGIPSKLLNVIKINNKFI